MVNELILWSIVVIALIVAIVCGYLLLSDYYRLKRRKDDDYSEGQG